MFELGWGLTSLLTPVLYVAALLAIALTLFYRIEIGIYFICFFLPLQNILDYVNQFPLGKDINDLLIIAMLIKWLVSGREAGEKTLLPSPIHAPLILLFFWTLLEVSNGSSYAGLGMSFSLSNPLVSSWKNYWMPAVLYLIIANNIKSPRQIKTLVVVTLVSVLMLDRNFFSVLSDVDTSHYSDSVKEKFISGGVALTGNMLAVFLAQYIVIFVALASYDINRIRKYLYYVTIAFSYYCILFLFSRGGYLAAAASLLFLGIIKERKILVILTVVFIFYQTLLPVSVIERVSMTKTEEGLDGTSMQRIGMWEQAKSMISERPLHGYGFFVTPMIEVKAGAAFGDRTWGSFHNNYLQTIVELGIVGLLLVLWNYFTAMWIGWRLFQNSQDPFAKGVGLGVMASVIGILAGNVNGSYWHFFSVSSLFWIYLGIMVRLTHVMEQAGVVEPAVVVTNAALPVTQLALPGRLELPRNRTAAGETAKVTANSSGSGR